MMPSPDSSDAPLLCIIDPGMGNLRSVARAWEKTGARIRMATSPDQARHADALVFPGQGGMPHCMQALGDSGFDDLIRGWIQEDRPFFGICLGLQALFENSEEGNTRALGVFPGRVRRFRLPPALKIPHMGWNTVAFQNSPAPFDALGLEGESFYFVHSYYVEPDEAALTWGKTEYGEAFVSAIRRGNCFATQFHPEKSQAKGLQMYAGFVDYLKSATSRESGC